MYRIDFCNHFAITNTKNPHILPQKAIQGNVGNPRLYQRFVLVPPPGLEPGHPAPEAGALSN